jgi:hypothetical protein
MLKKDERRDTERKRNERVEKDRRLRKREV